MREMRWAAMRMDARRAARRMVVPFASRPPKQTPHFGPTLRESEWRAHGVVAASLVGIQPTALAAPRTASRHSLSHSHSRHEQALVSYRGDAPEYSRAPRAERSRRDGRLTAGSRTARAGAGLRWLRHRPVSW